jgi:catechol 2,3-dioxygenase-like lactoylglutathione lyase family enzyme
MTGGVDVTDYDHVGIRISDRKRALAFYATLGFYPESEAQADDETAVYIVNSRGTRIHLICNGAPAPQGRNILMDVPAKWPGVTHPAFVVRRIQDVLDWAGRNGVEITEGPVEWDNRRITCFVRDPDRNVLEFNELIIRDQASSGA